jgi:hypothetical protein
MSGFAKSGTFLDQLAVLPHSNYWCNVTGAGPGRRLSKSCMDLQLRTSKTSIHVSLALRFSRDRITTSSRNFKSDNE